MALQSFKSVKAAAAYAKAFKRDGRKRQPVIVALKGGQLVACSRRTARQLTASKGSGNKVVEVWRRSNRGRCNGGSGSYPAVLPTRSTAVATRGGSAPQHPIPQWMDSGSGTGQRRARAAGGAYPVAN